MCDLCAWCFKLSVETPGHSAVLDPGAVAKADLDALAWGERPTAPDIWVSDEGEVHPIMMIGSIGPLLVHERIVSALETAGVTGWNAAPCRLLGRRFQSRYFVLGITGRCGDFYVLRESLSSAPTIDVFGPAHHGLHVRPGTWDGTDMFCPPGTLWKVVTDKTRGVLADMKLPGLELTRLMDYQTPSLVVAGSNRFEVV